MAAESEKCWILLISLIFSQSTGVHGWDSIDLELFDIVEEVKDNFYNILGLKQVSFFKFIVAIFD